MTATMSTMELNSLKTDFAREILCETDEVLLIKAHDYFCKMKEETGKMQKCSAAREKILSFAGIFNDMNAKDYSDFVEELGKTRKNTFNRGIAL
jgi:hypothetical protein